MSVEAKHHLPDESKTRKPNAGRRWFLKERRFNEETLNQEIVNTYFGLDRHRKAQGKEKIIDAFLFNPDPAKIVSLPPEVALERFKRSLDSLKRGTDSLRPDLVCLRDDLEATIYFLEEEQKPPEKRLPFTEYLQKTIHLEPQLIPTEILKSAREELLNLLKEAGYYFGDNNLGLKKSLGEFRKANKVSWIEIITEFYGSRDTYSARLTRTLGRNPIPPFSIDRINVDDWWKCEAVRDEDGFHLRINYSHKNKDEWVRGMATRYFLHEILAHLGMDAALRESIASGDVNYALHISTLFGPRVYAREGVAQTIQRFLDLKLPLAARISHAESRLKMLWVTRGLTLIGQGENPERVAQEIYEFYPFVTRKQIKNELLGSAGNVLDRAYRPNYGISLLEFESMLEKLNSQQKIDFLKYLFRFPMNRAQVKEAFEHIRQPQST